MNEGRTQDWGICGKNVFSGGARVKEVSDNQNCFYTLSVKAPDRSTKLLTVTSTDDGEGTEYVGRMVRGGAGLPEDSGVMAGGDVLGGAGDLIDEVMRTDAVAEVRGGRGALDHIVGLGGVVV